MNEHETLISGQSFIEDEIAFIPGVIKLADELAEVSGTCETLAK